MDPSNCTLMALEIYLDSIVGRGVKLDRFIFVQDTLKDSDKEKERKVYGIKSFVQRTTRNDIYRNTDFIKMRDRKVGIPPHP